MFIDTHAHLTMPEFSDLQDVIDRAKTAKVDAIVNASFDMESSHASSCLSDDVDFIYAAVGIHPYDAALVSDDNIDILTKLIANNNKIVAIGETGLDYFKNETPKDIQQTAFRRFLRLGQELNLPLIVHCRNADEDVIKIMREENKGKLRAVFHCFAGDEGLMKFAIENGFLISFTGNITFKKADLLRERAKQIPIENLMIETDCPYMAPEPFRGNRCEPAFVYYVAEMIAKQKGLPVEHVAQSTTKNAKRFFNIP